MENSTVEISQALRELVGRIEGMSTGNSPLIDREIAEKLAYEMRQAERALALLSATPGPRFAGVDSRSSFTNAGKSLP